MRFAASLGRPAKEKGNELCGVLALGFSPEERPLALGATHKQTFC